MSQQQQQQSQPQAQPLRLRNPTPYHLMATNQQQQQIYANNSPHPLADIDIQQQHHQPFSMNRDSPTSSSATDQIEFNDSFSQNIMNSISATSPQLHDYHDDNDYHTNHMYGNRGSFSSAGGHPMVSFVFKEESIIKREGKFLIGI